jgi:hypothetical protein
MPGTGTQSRALSSTTAAKYPTMSMSYAKEIPMANDPRPVDDRGVGSDLFGHEAGDTDELGHEVGGTDELGHEAGDTDELGHEAGDTDELGHEAGGTDELRTGG